jgi:hypothetical protein
MPKWIKVVLEFAVFWLQKKEYVDPNLYNRKLAEAIQKETEEKNRAL